MTKADLSKILIADDDPVSLQITSHFLRDTYDITTARNGEEALSFFQASNFDLLVTDILMPKMSGIELATTIMKTKNPIPILFLTKYEDLADEFGGNFISIEKPIQKSELLKKVEQLLSGDEDAGTSNASKRPDSPKVLFDSSKLLEYLAGDTELLAEIARSFLAASEDKIQDLHTAVASEDIETVRKCLHFLRGSAESSCTISFAHLLRKIEIDQKGGGTVTPQDLELIDQEFSMAKSAILDHLK